MRLAIPWEDGQVCQNTCGAPVFQFYEDDHGRIVRAYQLAPRGAGAEAALALLEEAGADVLLCGALPAPLARGIARAGIMPFAGVSGGAEEAALAFLAGTIVFQSGCDACGHGQGCSIECDGCEDRKEK